MPAHHTPQSDTHFEQRIIIHQLLRRRAHRALDTQAVAARLLGHRTRDHRRSPRRAGGRRRGLAPGRLRRRLTLRPPPVRPRHHLASERPPCDLSELGLEPTTLACLRRGGINTTYRLLEQTCRELIWHSEITPEALYDVLCALRQHGMRLKPATKGIERLGERAQPRGLPPARGGGPHAQGNRRADRYRRRARPADTRRLLRPAGRTTSRQSQTPPQREPKLAPRLRAGRTRHPTVALRSWASPSMTSPPPST